MPYDLKTKSGLILRNIPDDVSPDAPELKALAQQQALRQVKPQTREDRIAEMKASNPGEYDPESPEWKKRYGPGEAGAWANLGAGFSTLGQGVRQIGAKLGIGDGVSDEEIREKRRVDEEAAGDSLVNKGLQVAGEALPTMVVPFGTFAKGGQLLARGGGGLAKTLGAQGTAKAAQGAANALGQGTTRVVADSALAGAASGALGPVTQDESRLANAGLGAAFGGAVPVVGRAIGSGYRALTKTGAAQRAAREAQQAVGDDPSAIRRLTRNSIDKPDIPLTSAAVTQNEGLASLEQGMRARRGADFYEGDQRRAQAVFDDVLRNTEDAGELVARKGARRAEWDSNWQTAEQLADPQVFAQRMEEFVPALQQAMRSPEASNPAVRGVVQNIADEIERLGEDFTPAHLQQIRANLNARGKAMPQNAYQAAPRDSAAVNSLIDEIDNVLNQTTDDAWDAVKGGYATASRGVDESKAAGRVREAFVDPTSGRIRGTAADVRGDVPMITEAGLGRALDAARGPDKANQLSGAATQGLNKTLDALRRQNIVQRVKRSATAGGGSDSISNAAASGIADKLPGGGMVRGALDFAKDVANRKRDQAMIEALRDPEAMLRLLTTAARAPGDLTGKERALLQLLRSGGGAGLPDMLQTQ